MSKNCSIVMTDILQKSFSHNSSTPHHVSFAGDTSTLNKLETQKQEGLSSTPEVFEEVFCSPKKNKPSQKQSKLLGNSEDFKDLFHSVPPIRKHFKVHAKIGCGTFSNVYLATLRHLNGFGPQFALKHIFSTSHPKRIENEIRCLNEIGGSHHVIGIEGFIRYKGEVVVVLPYQKHTEFSVLLEKITIDGLRAYMNQLLLSLHHVHRNNVIHRDVKPNNFLFDLETHACGLVDFGLAQFLSPSSDSTSLHNATETRLNSKEAQAASVSHLERKASSQKENISDAASLSKAPLNLKQVSIKLEDDVAPKAKRRCLGEIQSSNILTRSNEKAVQFNHKPAINFSSKKLPRFAQSCNIENIAAKPTVQGVQKQLKVMSLLSPLRSAPGCRKNSGTTIADVFPAIRKYGRSKPENQRRQASLSSRGDNCNCYGRLSVCRKCLARPTASASRAGTAGFRPPEVLMRYSAQTTAVDMWSAGVIFLTLLSGRCPFFRPAADVDSLSQLLLIFGSKKIQDVAKVLGKKLTISQTFSGHDLRGVVMALRQSQQSEGRSLRSSPKSKKGGEEEKGSSFDPVDIPDCAFDLLSRLLDPNPRTRITATQALNHDFLITEERKSVVLSRRSRMPS